MLDARPDITSGLDAKSNTYPTYLHLPFLSLCSPHWQLCNSLVHSSHDIRNTNYKFVLSKVQIEIKHSYPVLCQHTNKNENITPSPILSPGGEEKGEGDF